MYFFRTRSLWHYKLLRMSTLLPPLLHPFHQRPRKPLVIPQPILRPRQPSSPPNRPVLRHHPLRRTQESRRNVHNLRSFLAPVKHRRPARPTERPDHVLRRLVRRRGSNEKIRRHGGRDVVNWNEHPADHVCPRGQTAVVADVKTGHPAGSVDRREPGLTGLAVDEGFPGSGDVKGNTTAMTLGE